MIAMQLGFGAMRRACLLSCFAQLRLLSIIGSFDEGNKEAPKLETFRRSIFFA
jgi:hypothetical protein